MPRTVDFTVRPHVELFHYPRHLPNGRVSKAIAQRLGKTQSEVIRAAVDRLIDREGPGNRLESLRNGRGMWQNRADLPNFDLVRRELDRTED